MLCDAENGSTRLKARCFGWSVASRGLPLEVQWLGWLALLPCVQALGWFHVFLFAYPVLVLGAESALRANDRRRALAVFVCLLLVGAVTAKTLGETGAALGFWSIKLWGTLGALWIFQKEMRRV